MNLQSFAASLYYALEDPMVNEIGKNPSEETVWIKKGDDRVLYHGNLRELYTYMVRTYNRSLPFLIDNYPYTFRRREDPKHRLEILQSLSDLIRENPCNWENTFVQIQFLDTNSYDESFQIIAQTVEGLEAFLKITFKEREQYRYTSEALIYGQVCNRCISENITPHVIAGIGQIYCPSNAWEALGPHLADLYDRIPLVQKPEYDIDTLHILVLEKGNGKALLHYFKTYVMEWDFFWKPVLFQIMYTLACFWKVGLQHNDLHFGNIMIEEGDYTLSYEVNTQTYFTFRTKFMVKIFDFDLATKFPTLYDDTFIRNPAAHPTGSRCRELSVTFPILG
jgi:hypothetical protein